MRRRLKGEAFAIVMRAVSPDYHERILAVCAAAGFHPEVRHEVRHWLSVVSLVSQGLGVALVPASLKRSRLQGAVFVPLADTLPDAAAVEMSMMQPTIARTLPTA